MIKSRKNLLSGFCVLFGFLFCCKSGDEKVYRDSKILMGTVVEITVAHNSENSAKKAIQEAMEEIQRSEDLMSHHKPTSLIAKINRDGSSSKVAVGKEVFQAIRNALAISRASDGAFDATILPISRLWGFDDGGHLPESDEIAENIHLVGYESVILDESNLSVGFRQNGMGFDLGAIAKGWAVDRAIEKLESHGIRNAIIDAGGDLRLLGGRPGKKFWRIGVQHPRQPGGMLFTLDLQDTAIVTSGDYERFFIADGVRYHHILDPATGQPARGCQSVTVLAATTEEADACATAAFVLGPERGVAFLRSRPGVRGVIVGADGSLHWSDEVLKGQARP